MNTTYSIGGVIVAILLLGGYLFMTTDSLPTVSAVGEATLRAQPDEVVVYVQIEGRENTAQKAQTTMRATSLAVVSALRTLGLEERQIQQESEQVYPDYSWENGKQTLRGYIATQSVRVRTETVSDVARIVDSIVGKGGLVQGINFELSDEHAASLKTQALTAAGNDAERKARALAAGVGKELGSLVSVQNQDFQGGPIVYYARAEGADSKDAQLAAASLTPRDLEVQASVAVTYRVRRW